MSAADDNAYGSDSTVTLIPQLLDASDAGNEAGIDAKPEIIDAQQSHNNVDNNNPGISSSTQANKSQESQQTNIDLEKSTSLFDQPANVVTTDPTGTLPPGPDPDSTVAHDDLTTGTSNYNPVTELVFVDYRTPDAQTLLDDIKSNGSAQTAYEIVVLNADDNGIDVVTATMAQFENVSAVHIISHGSDGNVQMGAQVLNTEALEQHEDAIGSWQDYLADDADLIIYGCDVAATDSGQTFINALADISGADVAASDDTTGHADLGGNWQLEYSTGVIETNLAFSFDAQQNWNGTLATITVTTLLDVVDADDGKTSLREAIIAANSNADEDTIELGSGVHTLPSAGDLDINENVIIIGEADGTTVIDATGSGERVFDVVNGDATFQNLTITGGDTTQNGGGINISNMVTVNLDNVVVTGNSADNSGGGISNAGTLTVTNSTISGNDAGSLGGGIRSSGGVFQLNNVTVSGNSAVTNGGGFFISNTASAADANLTNVTVSGNTANQGGGVYFTGSGEGNLNNTTITNNNATGTAADISGGLVKDSGSGVNVTGSIIAGNTGSNGDVDGNINFINNNIIGDEPGLILGPLAGNGGVVQTHELLPDSTGVNEGSAAIAGETDARGYFVTDAIRDLGAFEAGATASDGNTNEAPIAGGFDETWLADETLLSQSGIGSFHENAGHQVAQITIDGQSYYHGIGIAPVEAGAAIEYALNGATSFTAVAGLNDTLLPTGGGEVIFRAYVDGVEVFNSGTVDNFTPAIPVAIDTTGGGVLRLEVDTAGSGAADHAVWADAVLTGGATQPTTISIAETAVNGTFVGTYNGSDPDTGDTLTYSLFDSASGRFEIDANTGAIVVSDESQFDFEATNNSHSITVRIDDGTIFTDHAVTIELSDVNELPSGSDNTIAISEDNTHTFLADDFGFFDPDSDTLTSIFIPSLPIGGGTLTLNNTPVTANQIIAVADLPNLVYTPGANANGVGYDSFDFTVRDSGQQFAASSNTLTFDVSPVNDAPELIGATVAATPFINEIHYNNVGIDVGEAIEIAGPAGSDLTAWSLVTYYNSNGNGSGVLETEALSGVIADQGNGFGASSFPINTADLGNPDGAALVDSSGNVVQFLSWGGVFTAKGGVADGLTSTDVGVDEGSATPVGTSIQLTDNGWVTGATETFGGQNTGQDFALHASNYAPETIVEDTPLTFSAVSGNALSIGDLDAGVTELAMTVEVSNGVLNLGSTSGLNNLTGDGSGNITFTGTIADINLALEGLTYNSHENFNGIDQLAITVDDQGNTGGGSLIDIANVMITVTGVNDAPVLDTAGSRALNSITKDEINNNGDLVSDIILSAGGDGITDGDTNDPEGIAIVDFSFGDNNWEYSIDGGSTWTPVGNISPTEALLLRDTDRLRFVPDGVNGEGAAFFIRAWDQSTGNAGQKVNVVGTGGSTAFSVNADQVTILVTDVNDAPVITGGPGTLGLLETDAGLAGSGAFTVSDVDLDNVVTAAVDSVAISGTGSGSVPLDDATLRSLMTVSPTDILDVTDTTNTLIWNFNSGSEAFDFLATGETLVLTYTVSATDNDGTPLSDTETVTVTITGTNDAPTIAVVDVTGAVTEDAATPNLTDNGSVTFADLDEADIVTSAVALTGTSTTGPTIPPGFSTALNTALSLTPTGTNDGSIDWDFSVANSLTQYLADGETVTATYTITVTDDSGTGTDTATQDVTVTITGTNDVPVITGGPDTSTLTATNTGLTDTGTLTVSDSDLTDIATAAVDSVVVTGTGSSNVPVGLTNTMLQNFLTVSPTAILDATETTDTLTWSFDSGSEAFDFLAADETLVLTYTVSATDDNGTPLSDTETVTVTITGTNDAPVITDGPDTSSLTATNAGLTDTGTLTVSDADLTDIVTAAVDSVVVTGTGSSNVPVGLTNTMLQSFLTVSPTVILDGTETTDTLTWNFNSGSEAFDFLTAEETLVLTYTVSATDDDGTPLSDTETVTVTITGINDAPVITGGPDTSTLTETNAGLTDTGSLIVSDANLTDIVTAAVDSVVVTGTGSSNVPVGLTNTMLQNFLTVSPTAILDATELTAPLTWNFNSGSEAFDFLATGETLVLTYTVSATDDDGTPLSDAETITVTITGTNDAPTITAVDVTGAVTEDAATPNLTDNGSVTFADLDDMDIVTSAVALTGTSTTGPTIPPGFSTALNTALSLTPTGTNDGLIVWDFSVANSLTQYLADGETVTATYTITVTDDSGTGTDTATQDVTVTITGTNDAPVITGGPDTSALTEANAGLTDTGTLTVSDADLTDIVTASVDSVAFTGTGSSNVPVSLTNTMLQNFLTVTPNVILDSSQTTIALTWNFNSGSEAFDFLATGETLVLTYTVSATDDDGTPLSDIETVTVTITGTNDAPTITAVDVTGAVTEDAATLNLTDNGSVTFADLDDMDIVTSAVALTGTSTTGPTIPPGFSTALNTALSLTPTGTNDGSIDWDFSVANSLTQYLADGETVTATYTITVTDDSGTGTDTATQDITVTVSGTNDAPVAQAGTDTATEGGAAVDGQLTETDADSNDTHTYALITDTSEGSATINSDGSYMFDPGSDFQDLAVGETRDVTFSYEVTDNNNATSQADVTITVSGFNDDPVAQAGTNAANEDGAVVTGQLTETDADANDTHTYVLITDTSEGSVTVNGDGSYMFDPGSDFQDLAAGESRDVTFSYEVTDNNNATSQADVTITVSGFNDAPVAQDGTNNATEDGAVVNGQLAETDADTNDTHTYALITDTSEGSATVNSDGSYMFDPGSDFQDLAAGETRDVTFSYEVTDNNNATSQADVTITVSGTNDAPVAQAGTNNAIEEGAVVNGQLAETDADTNDTHTYALITDTSEGSLTVNSDGSYMFDPGSDFQDLAVGETRDVTFSYEVTDNNNAASQADVIITVSGTNDAPVAQAGTNNAIEEGAVVNGQLAETDADTNDTHTYALITDTSEGSATVNSDGSYSFDPGSDFQDLAAGETRDVTFSYEVADNNNATSRADVTITVSGTNDAPVAQAGTNAANEDGAVVTGQLTETDADTNDTHTYTLITNTSEGSATVNSDGSYMFDPGSDFQDLAVGETRDVTFIYEVIDNNGATSQADVTITVSGFNDAPVAQAGINSAIEEGAVVNGQLAETDGDTNDTHTYALITDTSEGSATVNSDGSYSFDPGSDFQDLAAGETRDVTFSYEVTDNNNATSQADVTITVSGFNDAPVAQAGINSAIEDGAVVTGQLTETDADTNDTHTYALITDTIEGSATINSDGSYMFDPGSDFQDLAVGETRDVTFIYEVTDSNGATSQADVIITVSGTNDAPVAQAGTNNAIEEGAVVNGQLAETDADTNDTHTYVLITDTSEGSATINSDGSYMFDPGSDFQDLAVGETRDVTFSYEVTDNNNAASQADVIITVSGTNDAPVAQAGTNNAIEEGAVVNGQLAETDADTNDTHTYVLITDTSEGSATINSDGSYMFDPGSDFQDLAVGETRDVTFSYEVTDNNNATSQADVIITVSGFNATPVAQAGTNAATEDGAAVTGQLTETDADTNDTHTYTLITNTSEGSATVSSDGSYMFDPGSDFQDLAVGETRDVTFSYEVTDNNNAASQADVIITVSGTNDAPVAQAGTNAATEDGAVVTGQLTETDADSNDTHTYALITDTSEGSATVNSDGSYTFDPGSDFQDLAAGETRDVTFSYEVTDNNNATSQAAVIITVSGFNDVPVAQAGTNTATEDGAAVTGQLIETDADSNDTHTYVLITDTNEGSATVDSDGSYMFDPGSDFQDLAVGETRDVTFIYEVTDNNGATSQADVTVTVSGTNDAPTIAVVDVTGAVIEDAATPNLTDNGSVAFDELDKADIVTSSVALTDTSTTGPAIPPGFSTALNTALSLTPTGTNNGSITWDFSVPNSLAQYLADGETVSATYTITVTDDSGTGTDTATQDVTVTITGTNDAPVITDGPDTSALTATNAGLTDTGTLTVSDSDLTDIVTVVVDSVVVTGTGSNYVPVGLTNTMLQNFLTVSPTAILDGTETTDTLTWNFNSGTETFNFLATTETLILTYTVSATDNDGTPLSDTNTVTVTITGINDAPVITDGPDTSTLTETNAALTDTGSLTVSDTNLTDIVTAAVDSVVVTGTGSSSVPVSLTNTMLQNFFTVSPTTIVDDTESTDTLTWNFNSGTETFDFLATGETLLLTYTISATDDNGTPLSDTETVTVTITGINDAPEIKNLESNALNYLENSIPLSITDTLTLSDLDDINLDSAAVVISENFVAGHDNLEFNNQNGITGTYNSQTGVLMLSGSATLTEYEAALRSVSYSNSSDNSSALTRTIDYLVSDGNAISNIASRDVAFTPVNDTPVLISLESDSLTYTENRPPVPITESLTISDADNNTLNSARIAISTNYEAGQDALIFNPTENISGVFDSSNGVLSLSGEATIAEYQQAIRSITYQNNSENPTTAPKSITFNINDGSSESAVLARVIELQRVNDAPTGSDSTISFLEDTSYTLMPVDFGFSDALDANAFAGIVIQKLPTLGTLTLNTGEVTEGQFITASDINSGSLLFTPEPDGFAVDYDNFEFHVVDDGGTLLNGINTSVSANQIQFDVTDVNDEPDGTDKTITIAEDTAYTLTTDDFGFSDSRDNNRFQAVTIGTLPESGTLSLNGTLVESNTVIEVTAIDQGLLQYTPPVNVQTSVFNGFSFNVHDDGGTANMGQSIDQTENIITFDVLGVNESPLLITESVSFDEGSENTLTTDALNAFDPDDLLPEELTFTINSLPVNGVLTLNGLAAVTGSEFTLAELMQDQLIYTHDGSETDSDFFDLQVSDGGEDGATPASGRFSFVINEVIDPEPIIEDESVALEFSGTFDSLQGNLLDSGESTLASQELGNNPELVISIETPPENGSLTLNTDGSFSYMHDGSNVLQDSFSYRVTNEDGISSVATVSISIEPPLQSAFEASLFTEPAFPLQEQIEPEAVIEQPTEAVATEVVEEEEEPETSEEPDQSEINPDQINLDPAALFDNSDILLGQVGEVTTVELRDSDFDRNQFLLSTEERLSALGVRQHNTVDYNQLGYEASTTITNTSFNIQTEINSGGAYEAASNRNFLKGLDQLGKDYEDTEELNNTRYRIVTDGTIGVSLGATAGVLAWVLRGGALFASAMAYTPIWSSIDPVRVMTGTQKEDNPEEEDGEVERYFSEK